MGSAVSASERSALRLVAELASKHEEKLKEKDVILMCQWAKKRGHVRQLKEVFSKKTWDIVGADLWFSVREGSAEAVKLAPVYGVIDRIMDRMEVEAKVALQRALGVDNIEDGGDPWPPPYDDPGGDSPEGKPPPTVCPLTEAEKAALGGKADNLHEVSPFCGYPDLSKLPRTPEGAYVAPPDYIPPKMQTEDWDENEFYQNKQAAMKQVRQRQCAWQKTQKWMAGRAEEEPRVASPDSARRRGGRQRPPAPGRKEEEEEEGPALRGEGPPAPIPPRAAPPSSPPKRLKGVPSAGSPASFSLLKTASELQATLLQFGLRVAPKKVQQMAPWNYLGLKIFPELRLEGKDGLKNLTIYTTKICTAIRTCSSPKSIY